MVINQAYESEPMKKFKFAELFKLSGYTNKSKPLVMFGCYHQKDIEVCERHNGKVVIVWLGKDTLRGHHLKTPNKVIHTTWLPKVKERIEKDGKECILLKIPAREKVPPLPLGNKVYTYLQKGKPEYHGSKIVNKLHLTHELLVGDHSINREAWWSGICDKFYGQAFIGLILSEYTGGGLSIVEMGLRGIKVVTNVLKLPHCIPWKTKEDIEKAIEQESKYIGVKRSGVANEVYHALAKDFKYFDLMIKLTH